MKSYETIEKYLGGELSGEDLVAFEAELAADPELKSLVENYDSVKTLSSGILEMELLQEVKNVTENKSAAQPLKENYTKLYLVIGAIAALLAIMFFINKNSDTGADPIPESDTRDILIAYYDAPVDESIVRSANPMDLEDFALAKSLFNKNQFIEAIALLEKNIKGIDINALSVDQKDLHRQKKIWLAHSYFLAKDYDKAQKLFEESETRKDILENKECMIRLCQYFKGEKPRSELDAICI